MRSCITCGVLCERGSYCHQHNPKRGYETPIHRAAQAGARAMMNMPCPTCRRRMTSANPPQASHITPLTLTRQAEGATYRTECRDCNLARRNT